MIMGARKRKVAEKRKNIRAKMAIAKLNNCGVSARKMRLVVDLVRGKQVEKALQILKFSSKHASFRLEKLLLSAISNWQAKNEDLNLEEQQLFIKKIAVDGAHMIKGIRPAPQGRAHRIRKRSCHVTVILEHDEKAN